MFEILKSENVIDSRIRGGRAGASLSEKGLNLKPAFFPCSYKEEDEKYEIKKNN